MAPKAKPKASAATKSAPKAKAKVVAKAKSTGSTVAKAKAKADSATGSSKAASSIVQAEPVAHEEDGAIDKDATNTKVDVPMDEQRAVSQSGSGEAESVEASNARDDQEAAAEAFSKLQSALQLAARGTDLQLVDPPQSGECTDADVSSNVSKMPETTPASCPHLTPPAKPEEAKLSSASNMHEKPAASAALAQPQEDTSCQNSASNSQEQPAASPALAQPQEDTRSPNGESNVHEKPVASAALAKAEEDSSCLHSASNMQEKPAASVAIAQPLEEIRCHNSASNMQDKSSASAALTQPQEDSRCHNSASNVQETPAVSAALAKPQEDTSCHNSAAEASGTVLDAQQDVAASTVRNVQEAASVTAPELKPGEQTASGRQRSRSRSRSKGAIAPVAEAEVGDNKKLIRSRSRSPRRDANVSAGSSQRENDVIDVVGSKAFRPGMSVRIHGLSGAVHLNGRHGTCGSFDAVKDRWTVKLPSGEEKALKAVNLEASSGPQPDAASIYESLLPEAKLVEEAVVDDANRVWQAGDPVLLRGLIMKVELNGRFATIAQKSEAAPTASNATRYIVLLEEPLKDGTTQFSVKYDNLQVRPPQKPASPAVATREADGAGSSTTKAASADAGEDRKPFDGPVGGLFDSNLEKLRKKAEAEARGEDVSRRGEKRSEDKGGPDSKVSKTETPASADSKAKSSQSRHGEYDSETLQQAVAFLPAAEVAVQSRKVVVTYGKGVQVTDDNDDSDDDDFAPGRIQPPVRPAWMAEQATWWPEAEWVPVSVPTEAEKAPSSVAECSSAPVVPPAEGTASPAVSPATSPILAPTAPPATPAPPVVLTSAAGGNWKLSVSDTARAEDKSAKENSVKRGAAEAGKKKMLEKLTTQLKLCLSRIQSGDLDDTAKEKYQDMIAVLKGQMAKVSGVT